MFDACGRSCKYWCLLNKLLSTDAVEIFFLETRTRVIFFSDRWGRTGQRLQPIDRPVCIYIQNPRPNRAQVPSGCTCYVYGRCPCRWNSKAWRKCLGVILRACVCIVQQFSIVAPYRLGCISHTVSFILPPDLRHCGGNSASVHVVDLDPSHTFRPRMQTSAVWNKRCSLRSLKPPHVHILLLIPQL